MAKTEKYKLFLEEYKEYLYRLEQNTYVIESSGLLYMDTPKTAGTSIKTRLAEIESNYTRAEDSRSLETIAELFIHDRAVNPLKPITAYSSDKQQEMLFSNLWKRVCVVRNPYDRLFSAWFSKLLLRQPGYMDTVPGYQLPEKISCKEEIYLHFEEFVRFLHQHGCQSDPHWDLQTRLLFHEAIEWSKILRFEHLQEDFLEYSDYFGGKDIILEKLNISGFSPDWESVSSNTIELIQALYRADFLHYDYPFTPPVNESDVNTLAAYVNAVSGRNHRLGVLMNLQRQDELELADLKRDKIALNDRLTQIESQLTRTKEQLVKMETEFYGVVNSRSWKVTRPMRACMDLARSLIHKH